ncbi:unnamed protein product, partial [Larinioides sclopetarius]
WIKHEKELCDGQFIVHRQYNDQPIIQQRYGRKMMEVVIHCKGRFRISITAI